MAAIAFQSIAAMAAPTHAPAIRRAVIAWRDGRRDGAIEEGQVR
jgi:hypothetical protein